MPPRNPRVLVVDADPSGVETLRRHLSNEFEWRATATGGRALDAVFGPSPPDLVLLATHLPDVEGFRICADIRRHAATRDVPVIFFAAAADPETETRALESGGVDFIAKPFNPAIVRVRIRNQLELKRARDLLRQLSITDPLTGISNRRHFVSVLEAEWRRALRSQLSLSLLIFDVDHFKRYNDRYGHLAGDECLTRIAAAANTAFRRAGDLLARYGGEEFVAVLPNTDGDNAAAAVQNLQHAIRLLDIPHEASETAPVVSVSIGYVVVVPGPDGSIEAALGQADEALFEAKRLGRNRAVRWE